MKKYIALILLLTSTLLNASENKSSIEKAEEKLKATFSNLTVLSFKQGPIDGLYEMDLGNGIVYYHPEKELLFFGEIWDKNGHSLTADSVGKRMTDVKLDLPLELAINIGDKNGKKIIEFTDPDCPYCQSYDVLVRENKIKANRFIFFDTRVHPQAAEKVIHILCSKNQEQAYHDVFQRKVSRFETCQEGRELIQKHIDISSQAGVSGTPSFIIDDQMLQGFNKDKIMDYFKR